ncbi:MAG: hypothetical protein IPN01_01215 [Deltaproteobacteria bacterium]|nr:hypothetical protein [Deltaproteobacteria bacterium]
MPSPHEDLLRRFWDTLNPLPEGAFRVKDRRVETLTPGGRCALSLFSPAEDGDRDHPRLRVEMPPAVDPAPPARLAQLPDPMPAGLQGFLAAARAARDNARPLLTAEAIPTQHAHELSRRYAFNSVRAQRITRLFDELNAALEAAAQAGLLSPDELPPARYGLRSLAAETWAGDISFDAADSGTYHSYGEDKPFVHSLALTLTSLPSEGSVAFGLLSAEQQHAVRRQRAQAQAHLDHLMRHKYAFKGVQELDIERTVGGLLIDRDTRHIASEERATASTLIPRYELLRIDPNANHPNAGAWVYRDAGLYCLESGEVIELDEALVRAIPVPAAQLTFQRALHDPRLRAGVRFDWDNDGLVREGEVSWVSWAGHCDIKAVVESLGLTLTGADAPSLTEYRAETDAEHRWTRELLLEDLCSSMELGSAYAKTDGSGEVLMGRRMFGGARNDSRPDRLQLTGLAQGKHFRWPLSGRQESFVVTGVSVGGEDLDLDTVFLRELPDLAAVDFAPNPRFLRTVEGDYNVIDVAGATLRAKLSVERFSPRDGHIQRVNQETVIQLGPEGAGGRFFLGTHLHSAANRELYEVWLDRGKNAVIAELTRAERDPATGLWASKAVPGRATVIALHPSLGCTLSREMKIDDPAMFQALLNEAVRAGRSICADTDMLAEVWNGVVTRITSARIAVNEARRVERWRVDVVARFGRASLEYLVRLDAEGHAEAWCPIPGIRAVDFLWSDWPDVGAKARLGNDWVVNRTMRDRGLITVLQSPAGRGGVYVQDDHIKHVYERLWAALSGCRYTILLDNKRYAFADEGSFRETIDRLRAARRELLGASGA